MKPGIYNDITFDEYRKIEAVNNSSLSPLLYRSLWHYKYALDNPREDTAALRFGRAVHVYVLEPDTFKELYTVAPKTDRRTKAGKEQWSAFQEEAVGKELITDDEMAEIAAIAESVNRNREAREHLSFGKAEVSIVWEDADTGVLCKARLDFLHEWNNYIFDLKTTQDASKDAFSRSIGKFNYHRQAAMNIDGLEANGMPGAMFFWIAVEKTPPYGAAVYQADESDIQIGRDEYRYALRGIKRYREENYWPCYSNSIEMIRMQPYEYTKRGYPYKEVL